jgi:predicted transposase YbfD/YdcC
MVFKRYEVMKRQRKNGSSGSKMRQSEIKLQCLHWIQRLVEITSCAVRSRSGCRPANMWFSRPEVFNCLLTALSH